MWPGVGTLATEIKCLTCETVRRRTDPFLDLQLDVHQNESISGALRGYGRVETLRGDCKYYCETCGSRHEAQKVRVRACLCVCWPQLMVPRSACASGSCRLS